MKFYFLIFTLLFALTGFSQVKKVYLTARDKYANNPRKAVAYALIEKLNDSTYQISKFNMQNFILTKGAYKDTAMKIPNGEFSFYLRNGAFMIGGDGTDTINYIVTTGYYVNGLMNGLWTDFFRPGRKQYLYTYKNGKLDGLYQEFDFYTGDIREEGNFIDQKKEGEWNSYKTGYSKPVYSETYSGDKLIKTIYHKKGAKPAVNLDKYIQNALSDYIDFLKSEGIVVQLSLTEQGKVDGIMGFNKPLNQDLQDLIKTAFLKSPNFNPGLFDEVPVRQMYFYNFKFGSSVDDTDNAERGRTIIQSRHANDIGRGLNNVGIGKPVYN